MPETDAKPLWEDDPLTIKMLEHDKVCEGFHIVTGISTDPRSELTKMHELCSKCCLTLHWHKL